MKKLDEILNMCPNFYDRESFANGYIKGYHQAEKDLKLSWEEVLKRFKDLKNGTTR